MSLQRRCFMKATRIVFESRRKKGIVRYRLAIVTNNPNCRESVIDTTQHESGCQLLPIRLRHVSGHEEFASCGHLTRRSASPEHSRDRHEFSPLLQYNRVEEWLSFLLVKNRRYHSFRSSLLPSFALSHHPQRRECRGS